MPILAEYKEGKFIPLEKVRLNNGDLVELNLVTKKQFLWKGALKDLKSTSVELQHKIKDMW